MSEVATIVLAAGRGTRFGAEPKLLALLDGKPLVRHVAEAAVLSSASPVLVVTGHRAEEVRSALDGLPVQLVHNAHFGDGLSTSLRSGFAALPSNTGAAVVLLADMPRVGAGLTDLLVAAWLASRPTALVPVFQGRRGNPAVLSRALTREIEALTGDAGAGPLLRGRADVLEVAVGDPAVAQDVDTPDALRSLGPDA